MRGMNALLHRYRAPLLLAVLMSTLVTILWVSTVPALFHSAKIEHLAAVAQMLPEVVVPTPPHSSYIEIQNSCGIHYEGDCVVARAAATTSAPVIAKLRNGIVLAVAPQAITDENGRIWYRVVFDESVRYPERISAEWYVAGDNVRAFEDTGVQALPVSDTVPTTTEKHILISRSEQMLYAYDGDVLFLKTPVSTGLDLTPTPRGIFHIYKKTPSRYMQGPLPGISDQYYDLPGVPWNLYFTYQGGAIHGAYWHNSFGEQWSHGCVNLPLDTAHTLYDWADLGTEVTVQD
jgi:lipoprotein-anchoring transpeptidase ErfK/SrfK